MQSDEIFEYEEARDTVSEMGSPASKLTFYILDKEGSEMTRNQLEEETLLDDRTLRDAFSNLEEEGVAYRRKQPTNHKRNLYGLNTEEFDQPQIF